MVFPVSGVGDGRKCCNFFGKIFGDNLKALMTIMKYSTLHGVTFETEDELRVDFGDVEDLLNMPAHPLTDQRHAPLMGNTQVTKEFFEELRGMKNLAMVPLCKLFKGSEENDEICKRFEPMLTSRGICYSFNSLAVAELFQESKYIDVFNGIFRPLPTSNIVNNTGSGELFGFSMVLNGHFYNNPSSVEDSFQTNPDSSFRSYPPPKFFIGISNLYDVPALETFVRVDTGKMLTLSVTPSQIIADEQLRDFNPERRGCRYVDETEGITLFNFYTRSLCRYECVLKQSIRNCGCTPWNYMQYNKNETSTICDQYGNYCFKRNLEDPELPEACHCPDDCEAVAFTVTESIDDIDDAYCYSSPRPKLGYSTKRSYWNAFKSLVNPDIFMSHVGDINMNYEYKDDEFQDLDSVCVDQVTQDLTMVSVVLSSPTMTRNVRQPVVSFEVQIGNIGGTLGLFTGMSILSFFEVWYWVVRGIIVWFSRPVDKKEKKKVKVVKKVPQKDIEKPPID